MTQTGAWVKYAVAIPVTIFEIPGPFCPMATAVSLSILHTNLLYEQRFAHVEHRQIDASSREQVQRVDES